MDARCDRLGTTDPQHALLSGSVSGTHPRSTPTAQQPLVAVSGLVRRFGGTTAVDGIDLTVDRGQVVCLLGPNGAGKSTTLTTVEGFARPDAGRVRVFGLDPERDTAQVRPRIGVMLQAGGAHLSARAGDMLTLIARCARHPHDPSWLLDVLGLGGIARIPVRRLSGGQIQRLNLAMALVGRPELLVLDEPTAGMDPQARHLVWDLVRAVRADGVGVLLTTHLLDEAELLGDDIVIIDHGRIVAQGSPAALVAGRAPRLSFAVSPVLPPAALDELAAALHPLEVSVDPTVTGRYTVGGTITGDVVATVTTICARHGALLSDLRTGARSLDEVYLEVTGAEVRP